jgi:hypothetical protein
MKGLSELDRVLRGEPSRADALAESGLAVALGPLVRTALGLAAVYGVCMGFFGLFGRSEPEWRQVVASAVKVPLLFVLTLVVTFPSLYVFNTLIGSRLHLGELARLLAAAMGVLTAVLAAFGPIVAFFSVTTLNYPFILLLNVAVFAASGGFGVVYLFRTLERLSVVRSELTRRAEEVTPAPEPPESGARPAPVARRAGPPPRAEVGTVFYVWLVVFGLVGAQMGWVLRPFVGSPNLAFTWFRPRQSSFFEAVLRSISQLFQ